MKLEINLSVDTDNGAELSALTQMLQALAGGTAVAAKTPEAVLTKVEEEKEEPAKAPKRRTSRKKAAPKEEVEKPQQETAPEEEPATKEEVESDALAEVGTSDEVTKESLQTLIREKSSKHREALKKKLHSMGGAKNVSTLEETYYAEFHKFMSDLD